MAKEKQRSFKKIIKLIDKSRNDPGIEGVEKFAYRIGGTFINCKVAAILVLALHNSCALTLTKEQEEFLELVCSTDEPPKVYGDTVVENEEGLTFDPPFPFRGGRDMYSKDMGDHLANLYIYYSEAFNAVFNESPENESESEYESESGYEG